MKYKPFLLIFLCFILVGCQQLTTVKTPPKQMAVSVSNSPDNAVTLIQSSAYFNTFNILHTNQSLRSDFTNVVTILNTENLSTITFISTFQTKEPTLFTDFKPTLDLLSYNSTNNSESAASLNAFKQGIQEGMK